MINKILKKRKDKKGFTLIELIVVIAILGILAAILIPQFTGFQQKAKSTQSLVDAKQIATAAEGLIAEGRTTYTGASGASTSMELDDLMIMQIAGEDIKGTISSGSVSGGHFLFTYTLPLDDGNTYVAKRDATGAYALTWS